MNQNSCISHRHNPKEAVERDIQQISKFQPPYGQLIIAVYENKICGLGSLKSINPEIGEIKQMFVDPTFRRIGAGRAILEGLLEESKKTGYKKVRLDSPKFMEAAHSLYRSFGFSDIEAYPEMGDWLTFFLIINSAYFSKNTITDYNFWHLLALQ